MKKRVVITGTGVVSPVGITTEIFWNSLINGVSGVGPIAQFDSSEFSVKIAAECSDFDPANYFKPMESNKLDRFSQFAIVAANEAIEQAKIDDSIDKSRVGVVVGSGIGGIQTFENQHNRLINRGPRRVSPYFIPMMISDIASGHISIQHGLKGPNFSVTSACATATHAIGTAFRLIQYGDADIIVSGGAEASISPMSVAGFTNMKALSHSQRKPEEVSRPFDAQRDGFVIGEGAGIVILEEYEHAIQRGATILAEIAGIGFSADAYHITAPSLDGAGATIAMNAAIRDAGIAPEEIGYINAHGTSTPFNDKIETTAIKNMFKRHAMHISISSTKSMTGHLLGAAGGIEFIASAMTVQHNLIPPTINYENPDPECNLDYTPNIAKSKPLHYAMSNTFGFGGHNACVIVKKTDK